MSYDSSILKGKHEGKYGHSEMLHPSSQEQIRIRCFRQNTNSQETSILFETFHLR